MKIIKVFLASSIVEFEDERAELGDFVRSLNDYYVERGIYFKLQLCENMSKAISSDKRKQEEYNQEIRESRFFYALFGREAGEYTIEEFDVALEQYKASGAPKIFVYFRKLPEGESPVASITAFKERLDKELGVGYSFFDTLDSVKQNLQSELEHMPEVRELLKVEEEKGILDGKELPSLESMKTIKVFLASSIIEFKHERMKLGDFVRSLNDHYVGDIYFKLRLCNDLPRAVADEGKRDEYNREIRDSRLFYVIFGKEDYAAEEFDVALAQFKASGAPKIFTYFRKLPEGESPAVSVTAFMERLDKEIEHYYNLFDHLDSVKLNLLIELVHEMSGTLKVEEGRAMLDGKELLSLENVPLFSNESFQKLKAERDRLNDEFARMAAEYGKNPDAALVAKLSMVNDSREKANEQVRRMEKDMLDLFTTIVERNSSGNALSWREKKASLFMDEGNYEGASAVLDDPEREKELEQAEMVTDAGLDMHRCYIREDRLNIKILKATRGVNQETIPKILERYEKCVALAKRWMVEVGIFYDYALFLWDQKAYDKALEAAEWLHNYYKLNKPSDAVLAKLKNLLGMLQDAQNHFPEAEKYYCEALAIYSNLAKTSPAAYEMDVADTCNNLAILLSKIVRFSGKTDRFAEAEKLFRDAVHRYCRLFKVDSIAYVCGGMADACNNLAILLGFSGKTDRFAEAEELFRDALEIYRHLAKDFQVAYDAELAGICHNLATLLSKTDHFDETEKLFREALDRYCRLAKANPVAYARDVVTSYVGLAAILLKQTGRISEAVDFLCKALDVYYRFVEVNPENLVERYNNLVKWLEQTGHPDEAEVLRREAESIRQHLGLE